MNFNAPCKVGYTRFMDKGGRQRAPSMEKLSVSLTGITRSTLTLVMVRFRFIDRRSDRKTD